MQTLNWLVSHVGTLDEGIALVNRLGWHLSVAHENDRWFVRSGDQVVLSADSREAVDVFLYGMALGYSILPDEMINEFVRELGDSQ
jgi:hypothetical protein